MGTKRIGRTLALLLGCVALNYIGKTLAAAWELPLWLDAVGTAAAGYALGPVWGAVAGASVNILANLHQPLYMVYGLTNIAVGVIVGLRARKKGLDDLFGVLTTAFLITVVSVAVSTPLNCLFFGGYTGNLWGDGVIGLLGEWNFPDFLRYPIGEFYVDLVDKVLTLLLVFAVIRLSRWLRRHRVRTLPLLLALLLCAGMLGHPARAAGEEAPDYDSYLQVLYNDQNGLPGGIANDIAQTADGVLWVGTYGGLYRYNGREFQWMNEFDSIKNVNCFYVDGADRLWIGTNDSGVSLRVDGAIAGVLDEDSGLAANSVRCITQSADGSYYVGTTGALAVVELLEPRAAATLPDGTELYKGEDAEKLRVTATVSEVTYTWSLSADGQGRVAAVTDDGTLFLLRGSKVLDRVQCPEQGELFTCCLFAPDGTLYAGTSGSEIFVYPTGDAGLEPQRVISCQGLAYLNELERSENGEIMVCAYNGMGYLDADNVFHPIHASHFSASVGHVMFDYQGNLWFTSSRLGLLKLCRSPFSEVYGKVGLEEKVVNTIARWQGGLYFGTDSGLEASDAALTAAVENDLTDALAGVRIRCLMADSGGDMWVCTSGRGVWRARPDGSVTVYDSASGALGDWFRSALELSDGTVALAGDSGVTFVRDGAVAGTLGSGNGLENPKVLCMLELSDGTLLAGTDGNGIAVIRSGAVERVLGRESGLSSKVILRMVRDPEGAGAYIVTSNSLCFLDPDGGVRVLTNFPYFNNYDVIPGQDGALFVACSAGIYVVDRAALLAGEELDYTLLDAQKGLSSTLTANAWNYVDRETGRLFLAGSGGVTALDMDGYDVTKSDYRMSLRTLMADETVYPCRSGETIRVPREARRVVFIPEIVNYSTGDPDVSLFLEGFDAQSRVMPLSQVGEVVYTNLAPGSYRFHLAVLGEGGETLTERVYELEKVKEIFDETWFLFYVAIVFTLTVAYLTWMFFRRHLRRAMEYQRRELELAEKQVAMGNETILTIARTVDAKDPSTSQHSFRVAEYSVRIARRLGFTAEMCEELRRTALLHDIGKIGIPDSILNKPAKLTAEEYEVMKSHVTRGAEILKGFTLVDHIIEGARYHHERYDGAGYAQGLKGEEIPLYARIIGVADAFDAMTANRVYSKKLDLDVALGELERGRGTQFDPRMADILLDLIRSGEVQVEQLYEESQRRAEG